MCLRTHRNNKKSVSELGKGRKSIFAAAVCWISMPKSWKSMYLWWFPRPNDYFEARRGWCTGAQESKKSKIAKNKLKRTQNMIEVRIKRFWVSPGTFRYHISQHILSYLYSCTRRQKPIWLIGSKKEFLFSILGTRKNSYFLKNVSPWKKIWKKLNFFWPSKWF